MGLSMGIYGALSTAVTGLRAQSFALENISGNIANSQTTGFKRIDTSFLDLVPDLPQKTQTSGSVIAQAQSTNTLQGDIKSVSIGTNMAINGDGFFVVEPSIGQADGASIFAGGSFYTRRGDFDTDKNGYLVNGSGYYLKGLAIDPVTKNISGSVPQVLRISNSFLPAAATTRVAYQLNLPQLPKTAAYNETKTAGSELLDASDFQTVAPSTTATASGASLTGSADAATVMAAGELLQLTVDGQDVIFDFYDGNAGAYAGSNVGIDVQTTVPVSITTALAAIQAGLRANGGAAAADATVGLNAGTLEITLGSNTTKSVVVADGTTGLGLTDQTYAPVQPWLAARVATVDAQDSDAFIAQSIAGGAITVYAQNGAPANVQMRWAKVTSAETGGSDTWNLFYLSNSSAAGANPMWTNAGPDYTFGADGGLTPPLTQTPLNNLFVNGVNIGNITLQHGNGGITQFNDPNGTAEVTSLSQNGFAAGKFVSVAINDQGRVVVSYDNGQQSEVAQVVTANFNAANQLKRMDGGIFAATSELGEPILGSDGGVLGASLEASNTDISEEFTKLIVTQQAYSAGTRIVTTANQMLQDALNMVR